MRKVLVSLVLAFVFGFGLGGCVILDSVSQAPGRSAMGARRLDGIAVDNNQTVMLDAGIFEGTLRIEANNATVRGAGIGRTVVRGNVIVDGNANTLVGLTIEGRVTISGNTNELSGVDLSRAEVSARGNNNRY